MRKSITLLFIILSTSFLHAGSVSVQLTGTVIGTTDNYNYNSASCSSTVNTAANAFDGNLSNYFSACNESGGWVGLDLGSAHVITKISYCPHANHADRMLLGVFEGANLPDFGDAVPLYLITTSPSNNTLTSQTINCSKGFRYVRYVGPTNTHSDIAEMKFYGYNGEGNNTQFIQITNLPTVIVHTTDAQDIVSKETYVNGIVSVISNNGTNLFTDSLEIKGRGNASWNFPKKPYKIKLDKKASLLGMPAVEKTWTLINNYGDKTLMRNLLAFDLSKRLGLPYTPAAKSVDLFLNGEYKGNYQLCDQVEVATGRVELEKMKATDTIMPNLSGGYLIEMDAYSYEETTKFNSDYGNIPVTIKYPKDDDIVAAQVAYIKSHFNKMENTLYANNYTDTTNGFRKYIDIGTFLRHFLVGEMSGNTDTYWSTNMYKKRNNDKFYFGPVWDFDIAYENDYRTYPINDNPEWIYASTGSSARGVRKMVNRIFSDSTVMQQLKAIYASYRNSGVLTEDNLVQVVNDNATLLEQSQQINFMRWDILNTAVHMNPQVYGSYAGEVDNVRNFVKNRLAWMDKKLAYEYNNINEEKISKISLWNEGNTFHLEGITGTATIQIIDVTGRVVQIKQVENDFSTTLNKGIYFIRISDAINKNQVLKCLVE